MHGAIQVHTSPSAPWQSCAKNRAANPFVPHTYEGRRKSFIYSTYVSTREYTSQKRNPGEAIPPVGTAASSGGASCSLSSTLRYRIRHPRSG